MKPDRIRCLALLALLLWAAQGAADPVRIAVAANFNATLRQLVEQYQTLHPEFSASISSASSGKHYAQIRQGAPFHVFFSADDQRTENLVASGDALEASRFVYALGQLLLWSRDPALIPAGGGPELLRSGQFNRLAIANPRVAPYGAAAQAVLDNADIDLPRGQLITGQSIGQTFNFVRSGNADLGLIAASQWVGVSAGSHWAPPVDSYPPIRQEAVLLKAGAEQEWASAFLQWVACDPQAQTLIRAHGYRIPDREGRNGCTGNQ